MFSTHTHAQRLLHLQPPARLPEPIAGDLAGPALQLIHLPCRPVQILLAQQVLGTRKHGAHIVALDPSALSTEQELAQRRRGHVAEHARFVFGRDERDGLDLGRHARREPARERRERFHALARGTGLLDALDHRVDQAACLGVRAGAGLSGRGRLEHAQLVVECDAAAFGLGLDGTQRRPERVQRDVGVERRRVVERDLFELLERRRQVVELGQSAAALRLDLGLDGSEPSSLQLDALRNDLFSKPAGASAHA